MKKMLKKTYHIHFVSKGGSRLMAEEEIGQPSSRKITNVKNIKFGAVISP